MSFGGITDDYDRLRSGPAPAAVDWLLPTDLDVVVDLGAGTGLLARALAGRAVRAAREVARIPRDGGRFGILWTGRDPATPWLRPDEWFRSPDPVVQSGNGAERPALQYEGHRVDLPDPVTFENIESATFRFSRRMTAPDLVDWLTTYSRIITASEDSKAAGRARAAAALNERFPRGEQVEVPMRSRCWRADRVPRGFNE
jgi:hypothetical protein